MNDTFLSTFTKETNLDKLIFSKYRITIEFPKSVLLPEYHGSLLRGTFGHALKNIVCIREDKDCNTCQHIKNCAYPYIFDKDLQNYKRTLPHPFVIEPEDFDGKKLTFNMILVGNSLKYLEQVFYSFREMKNLGLGVNREKFNLVKIEAMNHKNGFITIYNGNSNSLSIHDNLSIKAFNLTCPERVTLYFLTQLRIEEKGNLIKNIDFPVLFRNLIRRISNLLYIYCDSKLNIMHQDYFEKSKQIETVRSNLHHKLNYRYSNRQEKETPLYGFRGELEFAGDLQDFYPFLVLGQYLHLGKGTAFGMGRYILG